MNKQTIGKIVDSCLEYKETFHITKLDGFLDGLKTVLHLIDKTIDIDEFILKLRGYIDNDSFFFGTKGEFVDYLSDYNDTYINIQVSNEKEFKSKFNYLSEKQKHIIDSTFLVDHISENLYKKIKLFAKLQLFSDLNDGDKIDNDHKAFKDKDKNKIDIVNGWTDNFNTYTLSTVYFYSKEIAEEALRIYKTDIEDVYKCK